MLGADFAGAAPPFLYIDIGHINMQGRGRPTLFSLLNWDHRRYIYRGTAGKKVNAPNRKDRLRDYYVCLACRKIQDDHIR